MKTSRIQEGVNSEPTREILLHYAAIIESTDDAIISKTLGGIITSWNPAAERIFGYTAEEAVGNSILLIFPPDRKNEEFEILGKLAKGQRINHHETVRMKKDGTLIDVFVTISPITTPTGEIIGASKIARDITEVKRVRKALDEVLARFKATMDSMLEACQIIGYDSSILYSNEAAARLFGRPLGELSGRKIEDAYSFVEGSGLRELIAKCAAERRPYQIDVLFSYHDGSVARARLKIEPVPDGVLVLSASG